MLTKIMIMIMKNEDNDHDNEENDHDINNNSQDFYN